MRGCRSWAGIRKLAALASLWAWSAGCTTWGQYPPNQPVPIPEGRQHLRVTLQDGTRVTVWSASVVGDSLIGKNELHHGKRRTALALHTIRSVETTRFSAGKTVGLALGLIGVAVVGAFVAIASSLQGALFVLAGLVLGSMGLQAARAKQIEVRMAVHQSVTCLPRHDGVG